MGIAIAGINHLALTVTDTAVTKQFYMTYLGFSHLMDLGPKVLLINGSLIIAINPPPDPAQALPNDRFSESHLGLDHLSFTVATRVDIEVAAKLFDDNGISHGSINDLGEYGLPIIVMSFRDPDNIQLELTAPK